MPVDIEYGISYQIILNHPIDYYSELLPICIKCRIMIELEEFKQSHLLKKEKIYKLTLFPMKEFDEQLYKHQLFKDYFHSCVDFFEDYMEEDKYKLVRDYTYYVKNNNNLPPPMNKEEYLQLWNKFIHMNDNESFSKNFSIVYRDFKIQRIIHNEEKMNEIKSLEQELLNLVTLTEKQKEIIDIVLEELKGNVNWHGLRLDHN